MNSSQYIRTLKILLVVFLFSFTLFATSSKSTFENQFEIIDSSIEKAKGSVDWLLMFYMVGDIEWEIHVIDSINELESGYITGNVEVALMIDRHPGYDQSAGNWSDTRYYHLLPGDDPTEIESEMIQSLGEKNMGNSINLRYFVIWAMSAYSADKTALIIFGHGDGLNGLGFDYSSDYSHLTLNEVQQAMSGLHVNLFATESCKMSMLEIAYEWRTFTDYYLADQRSMRIESLDYHGIIEALCANPSMEPWELGEVFCQTYIDSNPYPRTEMYALINCSHLPILMNKLDFLSTNLSSLSTNYLKHLSEIRENMYFDYGHRYVDIQSMLDEIRNSFPGNGSLLLAIDEFEIEYNNAILYKVQGKYSSDSSGMGIFFPRDDTKVLKCKEYIGLQTDTDLEGMDFIVDSLWDDFLIDYLDVAEIITYNPWIYQSVSLDTPYQVNAIRGRTNLYGYYVTKPGIYNFTINNIVNEIDISIENGENSHAIRTEFVWSYYTNPEESKIEHISYWLEPGMIYILVESLTETANGTLYITKSNPNPLEIDQEIQGEFPYALGYIPPATIFNYYLIDFTVGKYTLEIDIDWPVGLEVIITNGNGEFILESYQGIPGSDFEYNFTITYQQKLIIGFNSHTGSGNFTFIIKTRNGTTNSTSMPIIAILPSIFLLVFIIVRKYKK